MIIDESAVGICVVTFNRPKLLMKMLAGIKERTLYKNYRVYIIIDHEEDSQTLKTLAREKITKRMAIEKIEMFPSPAECVKATNRCYSIGEEPYFAWISDDMEVEAGWLQEATKCMQTFPDKKGLVVFRDGIQDGRNATAGLISRDYIKTELNNIFQNEDYVHFFADKELLRKSRMIDKVKYCPTSIVWHHHPSAKGQYKSENDTVYMQSLPLWERDRAIFMSRKEEGFK